MKVSVIGQGYVGLTVAIGAAKAGHDVIGVDTDVNLINELSKGRTVVPGILGKEIRDLISQGHYDPVSNFDGISDSSIVIIAVPTPLDLERVPDLEFLRSASTQIALNVKKNALIINESTSFPGTLRNFIKPLIEAKSEVNFQYASAPERIDPGNRDWNLSNTPRVIGGLTKESTNLAAEFYRSFCSQIHLTSSAEVAEAAKLFENTFRQINIALANEFSNIASKLGFLASDAIKAAATKPFGFMPFFPSIGVGGHCIPIDPSYLSYISEKVGIEANFIN